MHNHINHSSTWILPEACTNESISKACFQEGDLLSLDLSKSQNQSVLFEEFCKIQNMEDAKIWKMNVGLPYAQIHDPSDIFKLSKSISWIWKFFQELRVQNTKFLRRNLRVLTQFESRKRRFLDEELCDLEERVLGAFEKEEQPDLMDLCNYFYISSAFEKPDVVVSFAPPPESGIENKISYISGFAEGFVWDSPRVFEINDELLEDELPSASPLKTDDVIINLAHRYLQRVLSTVTANLKISIRLHQSSDGYAFYDQGFGANYPWEAIVAELVKRITGSIPPKRCSNPACTVLFEPTRSHQKFCSRPGCRKSASRQRKTSKSGTQPVSIKI